MSDAAPSPNAPASFEASLARLEAIAHQLERSELPLEQSIALFEEGVALVAECRRQLEQAQGKVEILMRGADGMRAEPFVAGSEEKESA